jgi:AraC family transcriptional regulator, transcriptional activator of pobA
MAKKVKSIPVNTMVNEADAGIAIERLTIRELYNLERTTANIYDEETGSHRHNAHSFFLLESGTVHVEIDFQKYIIEAPSVIYVHPNQVHHTTVSNNVVVSSWSLNNESLNVEYLALLESITPAKPLALQQETFSILSEAVTLCLKFFERENDKLYHSLLKDSSNALVALVLSLYLEQAKPSNKLSRYEIVTKAFKDLLERNFTTTKRPAEYARQLNISTPYLNECVRHTTGYSVSHHIQQRVVLQAKRLLYHSGKSVKEIATELGYNDYPYFSRLFLKVAGITAVAFRNKNLD